MTEIMTCCVIVVAIVIACVVGASLEILATRRRVDRITAEQLAIYEAVRNLHNRLVDRSAEFGRQFFGRG